MPSNATSRHPPAARRRSADDADAGAADDAAPGRLLQGRAPATFWVWVDPDGHTMARVQEAGGVPSFASAGAVDERQAVLPYVRNPDFSGELSPFALGVLQEYGAEYGLELVRAREFAACPSRLCAVFLLRSRDEARVYGERHAGQVRDRVLVPVRTRGAWRASVHDSCWIDLLRAQRGLDDAEAARIARGYWRGEHCDGAPAAAGAPIYEVLLLGRIEFCDGWPRRGGGR